MKYSLRTLLIVPFVLQVIGITSLVGYLSYCSGQQAIEDLVHQLTTETGHRITEKLDNYLERAHQFNNNHIAALEAGILSLNDLDKLHRYLISQHQQNSAIKAVGFAQPDGTFLTSNQVSQADFESGATSLKLTDLPYEAGRSDPNDPSQLHLYALDETGQLLRPVEIISDLDVRNRPWYRQVMATGAPGWTKPFQMGRTNHLIINAHTPLYDEQNQLQGMFLAHISLHQLNDFLEQVAIGQTGEVFILERNGALIANSAGDPAYMAAVVNGQSQPERADESLPITHPENIAFQRLLDLESSNPLIRNGAQQLQQNLENWDRIQAPQQLTVRFDGKRHFLQAIPYRQGYGLNWLIVTVIPESDFMAEIEANRQRTIAISLAALLVSIGFGVWSTRRLIRPLLALNQATQKLADGDLAPETQPTPILEVESLRQAFHQMAHRLDASFKALKTSEQQFATLLENVPVGVAVFDAAGKLIWLNPMSRQLLGQDALGTKISRLSLLQVYRADTDQLYPVDQLPAMRALRGETTTIADIDIVSPTTGQRVPLEVHGAPVFDADGHIVYAIVAFQDIRERREVERLTTRYQKELEWEVAYKTAALEEAQRIAQTGSWELDLTTQQMTWTQQMFRLVGWDPGQSVPTEQAILQMIPKEDRQEFQQVITAAKNQGKPYELEHRVFRADGVLRYFISRGEAVFDARGQLIRLVGTVTDITERKQTELELRRLQAQLEVQATIDSLTQVSNRYQLDIFLDLEWQRCQHSTSTLAILMIDVDHFKAFNDHYGHLRGDECLQQLAQILRNCVNRASDLVSRYGGEEFILVLPQTDWDGARQVASMIQQALYEANIPHARSLVSDRVTVSIGMAVISQPVSILPKDAIHHADEALYEAKKQRNCYRVSQV